MKRLSIAFLILSASALLTTAPARAAESEREILNRIEFQVQVQREVPNDIARAVMVVEKENVDPAMLAREVNTIMNGALARARETSGIHVSTGNYQTWPIQKDQRIQRWRATQELILESAEPAALHSLLGSLQQQQLLLRSLSYQVSDARRAALEDELTAEALKAFRARAELIQKSLGAAGYDIVQLRVDHGGAAPLKVMRAMVAMAEDAVAGEAGTGQITASVYSVIQLK